MSEPMYALKMTPQDYARWQDARGNVEDATAILEAVKRKRDAACEIEWIPMDEPGYEGERHPVCFTHDYTVVSNPESGKCS